MKINEARINNAWITLAAVALLLLGPRAGAADLSFTNAIGGDFLSPLNWSPNIVPGAADNANFTNPIFPTITWSGSRTNSNAIIDGTSGGFQALIGANFWRVTNSFVIGQSAGRTGTVLHVRGELRVTNAAGTAQLIIGKNGKGAYVLNSPTASVIADQLFVTNNTPALTNSQLVLNAGTLTTLHGSVLEPARDFALGTVSNGVVTWNILGGTNLLTSGGSIYPVVLGQVNGARATVNLSGAGTTWSNFLGELTVGSDAASNVVNVSGGSIWATRGCTLGLAAASVGNRIAVSGLNTLWNARAGNVAPFHFYVGEFGAANELQVAGGAKVVTDATTLSQAGGSNNLVLVTDPGSVFTNFDEVRIANASGGGNTIIASNGATVFCDTVYYGGQSSSVSNGIIVTGAGSALHVLAFATNAPNGDSLYVGGFGHGDFLTISNGGLVTARAGVLVKGDRVILTVTGSGSVLSNLYASGGVGMGASAVTNSRIQVLNGGSIVSPVVGAGGSSNLLIVADPGSKIIGSASVGGLHCSLIVSNGGAIFGSFGDIGSSSSAVENVALVTGPGSIWSNSAAVNLGYFGANNSLLISNSARVFEGGLIVGSQPGATNNTLSVSGDLIVTNATQKGSLEVRRGQATFRNGTITTDRLFLTNGAASIFNFLGGTLNVRTLTLDNATTFFVGDGASAATLNLLGNGTHSFADGLTIRSNALLAGNGTISGALAVLTGGTLSIGTSPGTLNCGNLTLSPGSTNVMELNGPAPGSGYDQLNVTGTVSPGGSTLSIALGAGFVPSEGQTFVLLNNDGSDPISGTFAGLSEGSFLFLGTNKFKISYAGGSGNDVVLTVTNPPAGDRFWINPLGGNYEVAGNWLDNLVPTPADNANFTNNATYQVVWTTNATVANAFFNASSGLVTQNITFTWSVTNSYVIGQNAGSAAAVALTSGRLRVTNSAGNAVFEVRRGTNRLHAGTLDVDRLVLTNAAGKFEFYAGTLITRGAAITNNSSFNVGTGPSPLFHATWDVRSGTNVARSGLHIGRDAVLNRLLVTNGATLISFGGFVGFGSTAQSNVAVISGTGSVWDSGNDFDFGGGGSFNQVIVSNSGAIFDSDAIIGNGGGSSNTMSVIGPGSIWSNSASLALDGSFNQLIVSDSGRVSSGSSVIDSGSTGNSHNIVFINGAGSIWDAGSLYVGSSAGFNQLVVSNGAAVLASELDIGFESTSTNNRVVVGGGTLQVTNAIFNAPLDVRRGTNQLNSGLIEADRLLVTNTLGLFEFNGGMLNVRSSTVSNGRTFFAGNGTSPATLNLVGNGTHSFADGLTIRSNASLVGSGSVTGALTAQTGGLVNLSAGVNTPATLALNGNLSLQSNSVLHVLLNGTAPGSGYSQLRVTNANLQMILNSPTLELLTGFTPAIGDSFTIIDNQTFFGQSGPGFNGLPQGTIFTNGGFFFRIDYAGGNGNDVTVTRVAPPPPPLPAIPISIGIYAQDFNTLSANGFAINLWSNATTLPGWYASQSASPFVITNYHSASGGDNSGALYSFGAASSSERALGSISSGTVGTIGFGLCFTNDTGKSVTNCTISYTGEQWRCGGSGSVTNTLSFSYRVGTVPLTNPEPGVVVNWTAVTNLDFISPTVTAAAGALDGNQPTNRHVFGAIPIPGLVVPPGQEVFFRWIDPDDSSFDQALAVEDLTVAFTILAPRITSITSDPSNHFTQISGLGEAGFTYGIEAASNLDWPIFWSRLGSNTANGSGVFQFTDTNAPVFSVRFYRARLP